ncbi:helix-turn-helix domain-containing protein [Paenibacillus sp. P46E]|uniref:helix-turn-helix domain-containing protein n=1 Tax=Paenibacillus sp. P46E TaxID=1349436 RepID=UPI00093D43FA|nr:helix-turn-helix domain-containing protein [Paenibacillus sp. P46E]OKP97016.1 hypothetical protein A3849_17870 [Paenibacillus sp. P46E]
MSKLMTAAEAAEFLGVSQSTVYLEIREGREGCIPHIKVRNRYLFQKDKLEAWLENQPTNKVSVNGREADFDLTQQNEGAKQQE